MEINTVFISYAHEDLEVARKLYCDLKNIGLTLWFDEESLLPGNKWKVEIHEAIKQSKYFISILSSNSLNKKGYVQKELKYALEILDEYPDSDIYVIPVRIDNCEPVQEKLKEIHRVDMFPNWEEGVNKIVTSISPDLLQDKRDDLFHVDSGSENSQLNEFKKQRKLFEDFIDQNGLTDDYDRIEEIRARIIKNLYYKNKLHDIENEVFKLWGRHSKPPWSLFHNVLHNIKVENSLYELIPIEKLGKIKDIEWFCLLASVWLHDIGMILGLFGGESYSDDFAINLRNEHHKRTVRYIEENRNTLGLAIKESSIIENICKYHRKTEDISNCKPKGRIRVNLLAAYLRLALAIHLDLSITNEEYLTILHSTGISWESKFHWQKNKWVSSIKAFPSELKIKLNVFDTPASSDSHGFLPKKIENEVTEILYSVKDILIRSQISFFLDVETSIAGELDVESRIELELIQSNIRLEELSSASEASNTILKTFKRFATSHYDALKLINDYLRQVDKLLEDARPCHNLIRNIAHKIKSIISKNTDKNIIVEVIGYVDKEIQKREDMKLNIAKNARPFLLDCGSIFLYGYSTLVLEALKILPPDIKEETVIYIGECRGKSQYNNANEVVYCDGLNFSKKIREIGFKTVNIIPDISIGNFMKRNCIQKVLFGANGIDKDSGSFGHTCGHLPIADLANIYKVPVYVIADTAKFGKLKWKKELNRNIQWLTKDKNCLRDLKNVKLINPREDVVEPCKIKMLITEEGAFPPERIPKRIKEKAEN